jgi:hypothetical protein
MGANASADDRERVAVLNYLYRGFVISVSDMTQVGLYVDVRGAGHNAWRDAIGIVVGKELFETDFPVILKLGTVGADHHTLFDRRLAGFYILLPSVDS